LTHFLFTSFQGGAQSTRNKGPQRLVSKTYVYQTKKDASGNTYHEKYFSHNYAMKGSDGTTVIILANKFL